MDNKFESSEHREDRMSDVEYQKTDLGQITQAELEGYVPGTEEEKKLVRKIDMYLLPTIWLMYLLSYMDRTNIGNAKVAGMVDDLGMDSNAYSITLVVFFIGYVLWEVPSNMILARTRPSRFLPIIMFIWGCVTVGMAWVPNYHALIGFRIVIGILEAGFAPGVLLLLSSWYKKSEQSKRFAVYISAAILSGAFGGLLGGAITEGMDGTAGIAGWRWLFIIEGSITALWSAIAIFILLDFPANERRMSEAERKLAILRLQSEHLSYHSEDKMGHMKALKAALGNWRTWPLVVGYMAIVGSSTLSYFYPTLVSGLGYSAHNAQYMTIPIYIAAFVCNAFTGYFMDRNPTKRGWVLAGWMAVAMVCSIITCAVYNLKARYALLVIMASGLWSANGLALSYASSTFSEAPAEVRAILLAVVNALGNLAQIYGAYLFPAADEPKYLKGFGVISGLCFTGIVAYAFLAVALKRSPVTRS